MAEILGGKSENFSRVRSRGKEVGEFMNFISLYGIQNDKDYLYYKLAYLTAPTMAKKKPATLLSFSHNSRDLYTLWETYKDEIGKKLQMEYFEIRKCPQRILVIFFNRALLLKTLLKACNRKYLMAAGYSGELDLEEYLILLKGRFAASCPHEVGIFLGIPLEDVLTFVEKEGKGCLLNSYWKVYHNPQKARLIFASYDQARAEVASAISAYRG